MILMEKLLPLMVATIVGIVLPDMASDHRRKERQKQEEERKRANAQMLREFNDSREVSTFDTTKPWVYASIQDSITLRCLYKH